MPAESGVVIGDYTPFFKEDSVKFSSLNISALMIQSSTRAAAATKTDKPTLRGAFFGLYMPELLALLGMEI